MKSENNKKVNNYEEIYKKYPNLVDILLLDMTRNTLGIPILSALISKERRDSSKYNIIWATDTYKDKNPMSPMYNNEKDLSKIIPRSQKSKSEQQKRTKDKAEVFTPTWICNKQANSIDNQRFLEKGLYTQDEINENGIFNKEVNSLTTHEWCINESNIKFNKDYTWKDYVKENVIEITCGEAPYLVSRYNVADKDCTPIKIEERVGLLDRKLRVINENTKDNNDEWLKQVIIAYKHTYGYEWQGDNLFLARKNLLNTFIDYFYQRFNEYPKKEQLLYMAKIISWNIWQMDGLKGVIPMSCLNIPKITKGLTEAQVKDLKRIEKENAPKQLGKILNLIYKEGIDDCEACKSETILDALEKSTKDIDNSGYKFKSGFNNVEISRSGHYGVLSCIKDWDIETKDEDCHAFICDIAYTQQTKEPKQKNTKVTKNGKSLFTRKKV